MPAPSTVRRVPLPPPSFVHATILSTLANLVAYPTAAQQQAWALLLQTCLARASLERVVRQTCAWSATHLRELLATLLESQAVGAWEAGFNRALLAFAEPLLRGRHVVLLGDETHLPFWGRKRGELVAELRGGPPKQGAVRFFAYVTICALFRGRRVVLAVGRWRAGEPLADVLERLGRPLLESGMIIDSWLWDRGGATVAMLDWWQREGQPFIVAAPRRGAKAGVAARLTALEATWGGQRRRPLPVTESYTLHPEKGSGLQPLAVSLVVAWERVKKARTERRQRSLRRSRVQPEQVWRAVAWFTDGRDWRGRGGAVQALYRRRQSIESSYRMSHASRGRTSSRDARYRFVLFAISQLLQAVWSWLTWQVPRKAKHGRPREPLWLVDLVEEWVWCGRRWLRENLARPVPAGGGWAALGVGV
jgi:hypothetical protein